MVYSYKWSATRYPVPAQQAGEYMSQLSQTEGGLTAKRLLDESRDENALMHPCFEWDDAVAAEGYRLQQSRRIINTIVCEVIDETGKEITDKNTRAFVSTSSKEHSETGVFHPITHALSNEDMRMVVLNNALMELEAFTAKYKHLQELSEVIDAIDNAKKRYGKKG